MNANRLTNVKSLNQCLVHSRCYKCLLLSFKALISKSEQMTLTFLLTVQNIGLVHQDTSWGKGGGAISGQVNLCFPCLRLQPRICKIMEISEESKSRTFQKPLQLNSRFILLS